MKRLLTKYAIVMAMLIGVNAPPLIGMQNPPDTENTIRIKINIFLGGLLNTLKPQTAGVQSLKKAVTTLQESLKTDKTAYIQQVYDALPSLKNIAADPSYISEEIPHVRLLTAENGTIHPKHLKDLVPYIDSMERVLNNYFKNQGTPPAPAITPSSSLPPQGSCPGGKCAAPIRRIEFTRKPGAAPQSTAPQGSCPGGKCAAPIRRIEFTRKPSAAPQPTAPQGGCPGGKCPAPVRRGGFTNQPGTGTPQQQPNAQ